MVGEKYIGFDMPIPPQVAPIVIYGASALGTSLNNFASGHFNREEAKTARWENFAFQEGLEQQRRCMQIAQMKLSLLQQKDNQDFQRELAQQNQEFQLEIEKYRQSVNLAINQNNINFQKWRFEQEKILQLEILDLNQAFQKELNQTQHQNVLEQIRQRYRDERENPIINLAADLLEAPFSDGIMPLKILFSPPELDYDVNKTQNSGLRIESFLAEEIKQFLKQGYDLNSKERPTQFLDRAWSSKKFGGGAAVQSLHNQLKTIPVLILESEFVDNYINLRYCYWDGQQNALVEDSILSRYPYRDFLYDSAKSRAEEWKKTKAELLQDGLDEATLKTLAKGFDEENLVILEKEEKLVAKLRESGRDITTLNLGKSYKISKEDYEAFHDYLAVLHCLAIGTIADLQALQRSCTLNPLLPKLLLDLLNKLNTSTEVNHEIVKPIVKIYRSFYQGLEEHTVLSSLIPDITLDFALSLADLQDKSFAVEEAKYSASVWLKLHGVEPDKIFDLNKEEDCQLIKSIIYREDEAYLTKLQQLVDKVGETADDLAQIKSLLAAWQYFKSCEDENIHSTFDEEELKVEEEVVTQDSSHGIPEEEFSFEVTVVNCYGEIISNETKTNMQKVFELGGIKLEMVFIPGGTFLMGVSEELALIIKESNWVRLARPQHKVKVNPFYMSKYPITEDQYYLVLDNIDYHYANSLRSLRYELERESPANRWLTRLSGSSTVNNLKSSKPVGNVNYVDARNFCQKLSTKLGKTFQLPSEAQWEYACHAGTTTALYFGDFVKDSSSECNVLKWFHKLYRNPVTNHLFIPDTGDIQSVGVTPANAFGLYDMVGNVFQWCEDYWHYNYDHAPTDCNPWNATGSFDKKVLRGSVYHHADSNDLCPYLSSRRSCSHSLGRGVNTGFRVVLTDLLD